MGMSMRLGKSNAWGLNADSTNNISISSELVERTSEKTTYKVIVTIDALSKRMNRRVDDGEIYVCLNERAHNWRGNYTESEYTYCDISNCVDGSKSHRYLQQVVRGKNKYIFTVNLYPELSDTFYKWGNSYSRMVEYVKTVWGSDATDGIYYKIGASLLHIRNKKYIYSELLNSDKNTMLKESTYDFRWYSNLGDCNVWNRFTNMFSYVSRLADTSLIKLEL